MTLRQSEGHSHNAREKKDEYSLVLLRLPTYLLRTYSDIGGQTVSSSAGRGESDRVFLGNADLSPESVRAKFASFDHPADGFRRYIHQFRQLAERQHAWEACGRPCHEPRPLSSGRRPASIMPTSGSLAVSPLVGLAAARSAIQRSSSLSRESRLILKKFLLAE